LVKLSAINFFNCQLSIFQRRFDKISGNNVPLLQGVFSASSRRPHFSAMKSFFPLGLCVTFNPFGVAIVFPGRAPDFIRGYSH
jgi:hypothetical protein